jgi:hypothetical protein
VLPIIILNRSGWIDLDALLKKACLQTRNNDLQIEIYTFVIGVIPDVPVFAYGIISAWIIPWWMMNPNFMKPNQVPGVSKLSDVLALHIQMSTMQHDNMTANDARQRTGRAKLLKVPVASATVIRCCHIHRHSLTVNMRQRHSLSHKWFQNKIQSWAAGQISDGEWSRFETLVVDIHT